MPELKLYVPTYNHGEFRTKTDTRELPEYGDPCFPVVIRDNEGVRIVLGSHDYWCAYVPDVQIERRPGGWAIFLHPVGGSDPSGYVYFLDDGRSFLVPENDVGPTPPIVALNAGASVVELDNLHLTSEDPPHASDEPEEDEDDQERCELCDGHLEPCGENWDGLCPSCADRVSSFLDRNGLQDSDRDDAVAFLKLNPGSPKSK